MKRINNWKTIVLAAVVPLLITWQPVITYACSGTSGHCGG